MSLVLGFAFRQSDEVERESEIGEIKTGEIRGILDSNQNNRSISVPPGMSNRVQGTHLVKDMLHQVYGHSRGKLLVVVRLRAVTPVANGFHYNPLAFVSLGRCSE